MTKATNIQSATKEQMDTLDFAVGVDTSGSTSKPSLRMPGKTRLQEMQEEVGRIARAAGAHDSDGLTLVTFATHARVYDGVTPDRVDSVFTEIESAGGTNLGDCIREIGSKAAASSKNMVAFIFTDGEASNEEDAITAVKDVARKLGRPKIGLVLVQIGNDPGATAFLQRLDDQLKGVPDVVSTVTSDESEELTLGNLVWLAQNA